VFDRPADRSDDADLVARLGAKCPGGSNSRSLRTVAVDDEIDVNPSGIHVKLTYRIDARGRAAFLVRPQGLAVPSGYRPDGIGIVRRWEKKTQVHAAKRAIAGKVFARQPDAPHVRCHVRSLHHPHPAECRKPVVARKVSFPGDLRIFLLGVGLYRDGHQFAYALEPVGVVRRQFHGEAVSAASQECPAERIIHGDAVSSPVDRAFEACKPVEDLRQIVIDVHEGQFGPALQHAHRSLPINRRCARSC
jgi:hypothetical protein